MTGIFRTWVLLAALLLLPVQAQAADFDWMKARDSVGQDGSGIQQYLTFKGGGFFPDVRVDGRSLDFDTGTGAELGYGIRPLPYVAAEATIGYYETDYLKDDPLLTHDYAADPFYSLSAVPMALTAKAIVPLSYVDIYVLGGGGMQYLMAKKKISASQELEDDDLTTALYYGGGVALKLGGAGSFAIEVKRIEQLKSTMMGSSFDISGTFLYGSVTMGF
ncbi:MAG: outer membrane beta-barrel protein [Geobacter sp.]|nr:outer membrane beta-barrel protein [Geobacter sp.]